MQTNTRLGTSLGQLLASTVNPAARDAGALNGMRMNELKSQIELQGAQQAKAEAEAANLRQQNEYGTDDSLVKALATAGSFNSPMGIADFKRASAGEYRPPAGPPTQQQYESGANSIPVPEYVSAFPQAQQKFAGLKQMLALGDKNLEHLSGSIQGDQRNAITAGMTPANVVDIAAQTNAIDGKDPVKILQAVLAQKLAGPQAGNNDMATALLLSDGKTRYDNTGNVGTMDKLTGAQTINGVGDAEIVKDRASANQSNAGAAENYAQAGLAKERTKGVASGKGDGSAATKAESADFARVRDDMRADYNAEYPINSLNSQRPKGAPSYQSYQKDWLKKNNIDETKFRRGASQVEERKPSAAYQEYIDAYNRAAGNPEVQKRITERARQNKVVK